MIEENLRLSYERAKENPLIKSNYKLIELLMKRYQDQCVLTNVEAGWWEIPNNCPKLVEDLFIFSKIGLIHSEISEAYEGYRKDEMDEHLPHRKSVEVEFADAILRILDAAGALNLNVFAAMFEKIQYNKTRADHKLENREKEHGKKI